MAEGIVQDGTAEGILQEGMQREFRRTECRGDSSASDHEGQPLTKKAAAIRQLPPL
ncbi:hypothetical protein BN871_HX_00130 [Paenibacillus sp. P22]|nr:hypothetical protein BN871_HX_00130 [Paenibacillus sp. P22]